MDRLTNQSHTYENTSLVSKIIKQLMHKIGLKEAELARQTGLPQTTINRLLLGETLDPRANTLIPIAKFFGVTIGQLLGQEAINFSQMPGYKGTATTIPLIEWHDMQTWLSHKNNMFFTNCAHWITTEKNMSKDSFALKALSLMEPLFRKASIIIIDPHVEYKDGSFVI